MTLLNSPFDSIALRLHERPESKGERDLSQTLSA